MLQDMRKYTKVVLYIVVVAFIGTIIFAWGADITTPKGQRGIIGEVNGEEIDYQLYSRVIDNYYQQASRQSQRELGPDEMLEIRNRAWADLVNDIVFRQKVEELGLEVTDEELAEHLKRFPPQVVQQQEIFVNEQGGFDYQAYLQAMGNPEYTQFWIQVEAMTRPEIRDFKLQEIVISSGRVTGEDVRREYIANNEKFKCEYGIVHRDQQSAPEPDSAAVVEYYNTHKDRYYRPAEAELQYVEFTKEPSEADKEGLRSQIEMLHDEIEAGADFAQLARDLSEDGSAENGGNLGWFGRGQMVEEFEEAAFALEDSGDVSDPVQTQFGWHIIMKTGERENEEGETEIRASHILLKFKPSGQTVTDLNNKALSFRETALNMGFEEAAKEMALEVKSSGLFREGTYAGKLGQSPRLAEFAFDSKLGKISQVFEEPGRFIVAKLSSQHKAGIQKLEDVFARAKSDLTQKILGDKAMEKAERLHTQVGGGTSMEQACINVGAEYLISDFVSRRDPVQKVGRDPNFLGTLFTLSEEDPLSDPIMISKGAAVIRYLDREAPNLDAFTSVQDSLYQSLATEKRQRVYQEWFAELQEKNEIKDYRDELFNNNQ